MLLADAGYIDRAWFAQVDEIGGTATERSRTEVLDMVVKSGKYEYRLFRHWFAEKTQFCLWMTNLPRVAWSAERVMSLYRCRWQVALLFKGWRSHKRLKGFVAGQKAIAEGQVCQPAVSGDEKAGSAEPDERQIIDA